MINENDSVANFARQLFRRVDGLLLLLTMAFCLVMLAVNLSGYYFHTTSGQHSGKWKVLWIALPIVYFVGYVRLRQLFDSDGWIVNILHGILIPGSAVYFAMLNGGYL